FWVTACATRSILGLGIDNAAHRRSAPVHVADSGGGLNLLTVNMAPGGSVITAILAYGMSNGGTVTVPPNCLVRSAMTSVSATENVTLQCDRALSGNWSLVIGCNQP